jgi:hypothetical protein
MAKSKSRRRGGSLALLVGSKLIESLVPLGIFLGLKKVQKGRRTRKVMKDI